MTDDNPIHGTGGGDGHGDGATRTVDPDGSASPPRSAAYARARAAALDEMKRQPRARSWRRDAASTALLVLASTAIVLVVGAWLSIVEVERLQVRWFPLLLLVAVQALGVYGAIAPGRAIVRRSAAVLALVAAVAILVGRGAGLPSTTPAFACSTSHLAVDIIPLGLVLYSLRRFSVTLGRSLLAGVAAAATGAIAGELSCGRNWSHVLIHHVGTGIAIAIACVLLSRVRPPQTFAP